MYDRKAVRRRRAALAVFVALSIAILTAYFGESRRRPVPHLPARGAGGVAPIETGASRALKPVRDFFGWAGDTFDAKDQNKELKKEVQQLRAQLAEAETAAARRRAARALSSLRQENYFPQSTAPVTARVIARSSTVWYSTHQDRQGLERRGAHGPARDRRRAG